MIYPCQKKKYIIVIFEKKRFYKVIPVKSYVASEEFVCYRL